jgi:hypothetical protein
METNNFERKQGVMKVYLCGGTGVNIANAIKTMSASPDSMTGMANIELVLIDTSNANLTNANAKDSVYLFKGIDGGGKHRGDIHPVVSPKAFEILEKFPAGDMNVVISSLGGGSGSVIAPCIMRELLKQNKLALAVGITNNDSKIEVENTVDTMGSYEGLARTLKKCVVLAPFHNNNSAGFADVNTLVANLVMLLAVLSSRQNHGLDSADLVNWINFDAVTDVSPRLMGLMHATNKTEIGDDIHPITVATLGNHGDDVRPSWVPDYQAVGYIAEGCDAITDSPAHFVVADGVVQRLYERMASDAADLARRTSGRSLSKQLDTQAAGDDGMVVRRRRA